GYVTARNTPNHLLGRRGPGIAARATRRLLARDTQYTLLVGVVDVPHPADVTFAADHDRGEVAADAVSRTAGARNNLDLARWRLGRERDHEILEHGDRRPVDRFEGDAGAARARDARHRRGPGRVRAAAGGKRQREGRGPAEPRTMECKASRASGAPARPAHDTPDGSFGRLFHLQ